MIAMTDFFANCAFLGVAVFAVLQFQQDFQKSIAITAFGVVILLLHKIEKHLFSQTVLMSQDDEEVEYQAHDDIPLDLD